MTKEISLPARVDYAAVEALYAEIKEARGEDVALDGSQVKHLGASGLQLLLAAWKSWEQDGHSLTVTSPSGKFSEHIEMLGLDKAHFSKAGAEQ
ncbi:STAS domain-containing protein [Poseidonocella sp. HB161398]|uniref:STAS domain-containing protein n=1 Tax=Poseidonocella sp. HB161398 TaxID=2320855 RepID=UPI001108C989|nr:STAS domain-containing protein [Poseidonocella sp. HB161398]